MTKQFKLTVKGQVTIPKGVRDALGLKPGDGVAFDRDGDKVTLGKARPDPVNQKKALSAFQRKLDRAIERARPIPLGMSVDEYMSMIREPVPQPRRE